MSKQTQSQTATATKTQQKPAPAPTQEVVAAPEATGLLDMAGLASYQSSAQGLGNPKLQRIQRQMMAGRIGQQQGNSHLQELIHPFRLHEPGQVVGENITNGNSRPVFAQPLKRTLTTEKANGHHPAKSQDDGTATAETEADEAGLGTIGAPTLAAAEPPPANSAGIETTIQRLGWSDITDAVSAGADWAGDRLGDVASLGADAFAAIVNRIAPGLADLMRQGPIGFLTEHIKNGIQGWLRGVLGDVDLGAAVNGVREGFSAAFAAISALVVGDPADCHTFADSLLKLRELGQAFMESPALQRVQSFFSTIKGGFDKVKELVLAPAFDGLMEIAGGVFDQVKAFASTIAGWASRIRDFLGAAWDWVKGKLGISGDDEGGIFDWLKQKASEAWSQIKETLAPVIGPLQKVAIVLLAFSPIGLVVLVKQYLPPLIEAIQWLWAHKDDPNLVENAHKEMGDTILPQFLSSLQGFGQSLRASVSGFIEQLLQVGEGIGELLGAVTGIPLLSIVQGVVQTVSNGVQSFISWSQDQLQSLVENVQDIFTKLKKTLQPYLGVLSSIALAIANPAMIPVILAGWAWQALPTCYKVPIIDFLLDLVIRILESIPALPMFGLLWPIIKEAVLGLLYQVKSKEPQEKEEFSNKFAKIISGGSPAFIFGFVKGMLKGIWEGISDPFVLLYTALEGLTKLVTWLNDVANQALNPPQQPDEDEAAPGPEAAAPLPQEEMAPLGQRLQEMGGEIEPHVNDVTQGFMPAIQEVFSGGEGLTFESLMQKLGDAWDAVQNALRDAGKTLANKIFEFFLQDSAEGEMGEGVGWLAGTIVFEVVLGILTAGSWTAATGFMKAVKFFAKALDWTGEAMGMAFKALKRVGGYLMDAIKAIGRMLDNAGGAIRTVMDAAKEIAQKLITFGEELLGFSVRSADEVAGGAARSADEVAGGAARGADDVAGGAGRRADEFAEETAEETAERGGRNTTDDLTENSREYIEARSITAANEKIGTPAHILIRLLSRRFPTRRFNAQPVELSKHRIVMRTLFEWQYDPDELVGLSIYEEWMPPPGAKPKPPSSASPEERLEWLKERFRMHRDQAKERFEVEGLTPRQAADEARYRTHRGSRIDEFAKDSIFRDPDLAEVITAPNFHPEPDILDSVLPVWFDMTTRKQWENHMKRYRDRYGPEGHLLETD